MKRKKERQKANTDTRTHTELTLFVNVGESQLLVRFALGPFFKKKKFARK